MRWLIAAVLAAALVSCGKAAPPTATAGGGGGAAPTWLHSLDEALAQAKSSGKPILVDFTAPWWPSCKSMEAETFPDAAVKARLSSFVLLHVDTDQDSETASKYGVESIPDIRVLKSDGTSVHQVIGSRSPADFLEELDNGLSKAK